MTDLQTAARQALKVLEVLAEGAEEECGEETCPDCRAWRPVWAAITALKTALAQPEPDIYALPTNRKEPRPGLVNLEEFPGFLYESPNGWHIGDMKVVKWLLNNREVDYWKQFKEGA